MSYIPNISLLEKYDENIDTNDIDLFVGEKCIVSSFHSLVSQYYLAQRKSPDIIAIPSIVNIVNYL